MTTFDMALIQRGARLRRSPYFDATLRAGCRAYTVYNHMFLPTRYDDLHAEYERLRTGVTVWDVSVERQVEITGPDAFAFTNLLTPRDLSKCAVGQGKYVLITAEDGGIVNDPVLLRLGKNHFWLALADSDVLLWAKGVALNSGLDVRLCEPDVSPMQVQGPESKEVVRRLFGDGVAGLRYYWFAETDLDGIPVVVTRTGWSGEVGYEIYLRDGRRGVELWDRVMDAGADLGIAPTGPSDIRRIEAGILNYGIDMTLDTNPYEVGMGWQVDRGQEGDSIGREALARIAAEGPRRRLAGVEMDTGDALPVPLLVVGSCRTFVRSWLDGVPRWRALTRAAEEPKCPADSRVATKPPDAAPQIASGLPAGLPAVSDEMRRFLTVSDVFNRRNTQ